jgi:N-acetylneuraminate synthase
VTSTPTFIIAEAGVNHNGDIARAIEMVAVAAEAGANAVKFQSFKAEKIATASAPKADYQTRNTGAGDGQLEMLKALELTDEDHHRLFEACENEGIEFMSTPFDMDSVRFLANTLGAKRLKVASGEITNAPLLLEMARTGKPTILSTGMSTLEEVELALGVLAFGYISANGDPSLESFAEAFQSNAGQAALKSNVTILHCTSEYPAPPETVHLRAMATLANCFGLPIGLSDHSVGVAVATAAIACGARVIEKHFTLDRSLPGPDHEASLTPEEFAEMVVAIRIIEQALGSENKAPGTAELKTRQAARKSLVALKSIAKGDFFSSANLGAKRPGTGIAPMAYWSYLGRRALRDYAVDDLIDQR